MRCPYCGYNLSKTGRETRVSRKAKEEFVRRNGFLFKHEGVSKTAVWLARQELNYSPKTVDLDIAAGLQKAYEKVFG